jgi:plastocyanin
MIRRQALALLAGVVWLATSASAQTNHVVQVTNQSTFNPSQITIQVGDTVTFQKGSTSLPHNVVADGFGGGCTFGPTCFRCGSGNGCQGQGASGASTSAAFSFTLSFFDAPGTFPYFCEVHGGAGGLGMAGRIIVEEGTSPTPTPTPPPPPPPTNEAGSIRFTNANYNRAENVGSATVQVERIGGDDDAVSVSFSTSNGSAVAGQDYTATNGILSWADNEDGVKSFVVPITNDGDDEPNQTIQLALSNPTGGATLGNPSNATITIVDDDGAAGNTGTTQFTSTSFNVLETAPQATLTVSRTGGSQGAASVDYSTANGTATAGQDYTAVGGTLNWANGDSTQKSFQVPILDDIDNEGSETVSVSLSGASGATLGTPAAATLTILDNESVPPCTDGDFQVCLLNRFLVRVHWMRNNGTSGEGRAIKLTDSSASFEFFEPGNTELVAKIRDNGCALAPGNPLRNFWVFVAGLTNVRIELTIIDTRSGAMRQFFNGLNQPFFTPAADSPDGKANPAGAIQATTEALGAFPTCDA